MTEQRLVPDTIAELSFCKCKTGCKTKHCKCQEKNICIEMCHCDSCGVRQDDIYF